MDQKILIKDVITGCDMFQLRIKVQCNLLFIDYTNMAYQACSGDGGAKIQI